MKRLALILLAFTAIPVLAQEPRFGEKVDVNVVLLDAAVTDAKGNQILGLDKNDFVVTENGVPQTIDSVEYFTNRTLLTSPEGNAPFAVERVHADRYYVFFFDKPTDGQLWDRLANARNAAKHFVDSLRPGDHVAVAGHDVRLKVYSDFTSDKAALARAIDDAGSFTNGITTGSGPILSAVDQHRMMSESGTVYEALDVLADALRATKGRKNLLLFSAGIYEPGQEQRNGVVLSQSRYYRPMIDSLNAADVSVYAMNLLPDVDETPIFHQTLDQITADTNGEYFRHAVNFDPVLKRIEQSTNGYYLITYTSHHARGTTGFQKVDVSVKNREMHVRARAGYSYGD